ncbi:MAG: DUF5680 domain-containing protein [Eubacteriales bacterium]|nr:DUF5680 domain-containing protein [Eubacteriales bacterium]
MIFPEKLQLLRKSRGITQEALADECNVSRQAIAKWEAGQSYPDIVNLIAISRFFCVSIDHLVKDDDCTVAFVCPSVEQTIPLAFLLKAKVSTYAAKAPECAPSRPASHDLRYQEGEMLYIDTYLGGQCFSGEEAVWVSGQPVYAMNYSGRVLDESFSGDFLKAALLRASAEMPYRGPALFAQGDYLYRCSVEGTPQWFQGYEEITCLGVRTYECFFHGGEVRS